MKIATNDIGEFIIELSDGKAFKITEKDGDYLSSRGEVRPRHYLRIKTLADKESGQRPNIWVNDRLHHQASVTLCYEPFDEGYEQGEY